MKIIKRILSCMNHSTNSVEGIVGAKFKVNIDSVVQSQHDPSFVVSGEVVDVDVNTLTGEKSKAWDSPCSNNGRIDKVSELPLESRREEKAFKYVDSFHDVSLRILLIDDKVVPSDDNKVVPSNVDEAVPSDDDKVVPSNADEAVPSNADEAVPSDDNKVVSSNDDEAVPSNADGTVSSNADETVPSDDNKVVPSNDEETILPDGVCKIEKEIKNNVGIKKCIDPCGVKGDCKLRTIKKLMKGDSSFSANNLYWNKTKTINTFYCNFVSPDYFNNVDELLSALNIGYSNHHEIKDCNGVQIVGVRDVRTALLLLRKYKFDMIFCDYLLGKKEEKKEEREYANQLFDFLSKKNSDKALESLRQNVLDNRGPLNKWWIMPVTGFNQTFIQDLYRNQINLIDYRWNISNGADPITTPWQFLYHLNRFVELQLRSCVFTMEQLLTFLLYTCQDLKALEDLKDGKLQFDDFQSFIGSEYSTLMQLYGNKLPIKRDAVMAETSEEDKTNKSVFATYVWKEFYANEQGNYINEIELHRLMHRFYHQASVMYNDRSGVQRLNEAFEDLDLFIRTNLTVKEEISKNIEWKDKKKIENGLSYLKGIIEKCTSNTNKDN